MSIRHYLLTLSLCVLVALPAYGQDKPKSPPGSSATQIGDNWIEVEYSRPILRGRAGIFGEGESYGESVNAGAPVWRAGANRSTIFRTDTDLKFGDTTVPAGEYTLFIDLGQGEWTLILSSHKGKSNFRSEEEGIWGSYGYTMEKDVVRSAMTMMPSEMSFDQLTFGFVNVSAEGGTLAIMWDKTIATCDFTVAG